MISRDTLIIIREKNCDAVIHKAPYIFVELNFND